MTSFQSLKAYMTNNDVPFTTEDGKLIFAKSQLGPHKEYVLTAIANNKGLVVEQLPGKLTSVADATEETGTQGDYSVEDINPKGDRILVRVIPPDDTSLAGISIPDGAKDKPQFGIVVRAGNKVDEETKEGNKIIYGQWAGNPLTVQGQEYLMMKDSDILAYL